jgi:hypothetical protein
MWGFMWGRLMYCSARVSVYARPHGNCPNNRCYYVHGCLARFWDGPRRSGIAEYLAQPHPSVLRKRCLLFKTLV